MSNTQNPQAVVDADDFAVRRTIRIAAPREKVWRTVTEPELISQWFGHVTLTGTGAGATGSIGWPGGQLMPLRVESMDPPTTVSYRWCNEDDRVPETIDEEHSTVFTFSLLEDDGGTLLTVVETGFERSGDPAAHMADHRDGWDAELDKLVALLEERA
ncbi:SRPBCC domain-containing protein [Microbacterium sp. NPDC055903]